MKQALCLCALMRALRSFSVLLLLTPCFLALRCHLYHEIWEDGHKLEILPDICSSNKYCVSVIYRDPDSIKKNGYSVGCDRVDCEQSDNEMFTGWRAKPGGMKCRKHRDYGKHGEVCCCKTDLCNTSTQMRITLTALTGILLFHI